MTPGLAGRSLLIDAATPPGWMMAWVSRAHVMPSCLNGTKASTVNGLASSTNARLLGHLAGSADFL